MKHPLVHAILYTKRIELLPLLRNAPANLHVRYSSWEGDEAGELRARELGFSITHVVRDGSGNCPYQKSLARFNARKHAIARDLRSEGVPLKDANRAAEKQAASEIGIWHCRNCAEHGSGCCGQGDIRFNVVESGEWTSNIR